MHNFNSQILPPIILLGTFRANPYYLLCSNVDTFLVDEDDQTDSETVSTDGEADYSAPGLQGLPPAQVDEHLFFEYQRHKSNWERHMRNPQASPKTHQGLTHG